MAVEHEAPEEKKSILEERAQKRKMTKQELNMYFTFLLRPVLS